MDLFDDFLNLVPFAFSEAARYVVLKYVLSFGHIVIHCWCFEVLGIVWTLAYMRDNGLCAFLIWTVFVVLNNGTD